MEQQDYTISVEKILARKFGDKTPRLLVKFVKKLLHEDWLNGWFVKGYTGVEFTEKTLEYLGVKLQIEGLENVPDEGRFTVASNHPLGGNDALALITIFGKKWNSNIRFMANDFLASLKQLQMFMVGVNKTGGQSRALPALTEEMFAGDNQVLMFPGSICSRKIDGKVQDLPWTKAFLAKSVKHHRDIIPMHFYGQNSWRFYFLDWVGKITGLNKKFPLAMALLVDELYRAQGSTYRIVIGKPIPWQTFDESRKPIEWAQWVRAKVYEL